MSSKVALHYSTSEDVWPIAKTTRRQVQWAPMKTALHTRALKEVKKIETYKSAMKMYKEHQITLEDLQKIKIADERFTVKQGYGYHHEVAYITIADPTRNSFFIHFPPQPLAEATVVA